MNIGRHLATCVRSIGANGTGLFGLVLGLLIVPLTANAQAITGKVTDAAGGPLVAVTVSVEGTTLGSITRDDGTYRIGGVPAGTRVLVARRVGYVAQRRTVTVATGDLTVDFQLDASATALEGVVTTATGQQRKIELGNAVASVDVAELKETQAIKSMSDLLTARATGIVVLPATVSGTASRIRIRGENSLSVSNDPIYIIDGIRMNAEVSNATIGGDNPGTNSRTSRLSDINPEDIENIEVVKGPSAATLYGTDAANGVIVITTKRGKAGPPRWSFHGERGLNVDPGLYPVSHAIVGDLVSTPAVVPTRCNTFQIYHFDTTSNTLSPQCTFISAHAVDLSEIDSTTWLEAGPRTVLGGQVSGGSNELRYFVSGDRIFEYGPFGLPDVDRNRFDSLAVPIRDEMERPGKLDQYAFRSNLNAALGSKFDLSTQAGFTKIDQRFPTQGNDGESVMQQLTFAPGCVICPMNASPALGGWGGGSSPGQLFRTSRAESVNRFIGSVSGNARPLSWLTGSGDVGIDATDQRNSTLDRPGETAGASGSAIDERSRYNSFTTNLRGTGTWQAREWAQLRSSAGWQFVATNRSIVTARGTDLGPGGEVPGQGVNQFVNSSNRPIRTMGYYLEEQLALRDRLYLTGAVRSDQASAFGSDFQNVFYPKASVSWIASDENFFPAVPFMSQLRLRASYGTSGVQPGLTEALTVYSTRTAHYGNETSTSLVLSSTGNPDLKPERSTEFETGFDSRWWDDRITAEFTFYRKRTKDALFTQPTATSAGVPGFRTNLGGMQNQGVEYNLNAQLVDTRNYGFDLAFTGSNNQNKIVDMGPVIVTSPFASEQPGRPIGSVYKRRITWNDRNNDGYLGVQEVIVPLVDSITNRVYVGPALDPVQMTLTTGAEFFERRLRLQAMFDRKDGAFANNGNHSTACNPGPFPGCRGINDINASLFDQARGIALRFRQRGDGYIESKAYTRLRELSASYNLSERFAGRYLRAESARLTLAGRNVALWADEWTEGDPEQNAGTGGASNLWSYGPPSYYMVRLNVTY